MTVSTQVPTDHPLMKAWTAFKLTEEFANSKQWASYAEHLDGSLWAMFSAGFAAAQPRHDNGVPAPEDDIAKAKRIMNAVDDYHNNPTNATRGDLRAVVIDQLAAAPSTAPVPAHVEPMLVSALRNLRERITHQTTFGFCELSGPLARALADTKSVLNTYPPTPAPQADKETK